MTPLRQLTSLDAQFLAIEDGRTHMHVSALGVYDPSTAPGGALTREAVRDLIAARLHLLAPFRWRLAHVPLGIDHPYWFDDADVDLDYHVRELALPAPGDDRQLARQVERIVSRPLDRSRPLWELYVIQGLEGGHVGVLTKVHHAAVDGMSGAEILSELTDLEPDPGPLPRAPAAPMPAPRPGEWEMLARGLTGIPRQGWRAARAGARALPHLDEIPTMRNIPGIAAIAAGSRRAARMRPRHSDEGLLDAPHLHAPRTSLNGPIGPHRRVAFSRQRLTEVKQIKNHFAVTVNDVVVAICAGALRSLLDSRDELPDQPLLAIVPVSVRTPEQRGTFGNRVASMLAPLPTHLADPEQRLHAAHEAMRAAKEHHDAVPATLLQDANDVILPALFSRAARATVTVAARMPGEAAVNTVVSNVPGSPVPIHLAGARLQALYPVSAVIHGIGVNLTVMSYRDELCFGVLTDRDTLDDAWPLAAALRASQAELLALTRRQAPR